MVPGKLLSSQEGYISLLTHTSMKIRNIEGLTIDQLQYELKNGAKFVMFEYTISILVMTFKRSTDIYFIRGNESHWGKSIPFTLLSLLLGWWGFPWGFIYTPMALATNLSGGKNVTQHVVSSLTAQSTYN